MIEKLIEIYLAVYHWVREHILRRPPLYAGRPVEISIRNDGGEWIELGTVESYDLHIDMTGDGKIELPDTVEFKGHLVIAPRVENGVKVDGDLFFDGFTKDKEEPGENPDAEA